MISPIGFERPEYLWLMLLWIPIIAVWPLSRRKIVLWRKIAATIARCLLLAAVTLALAGIHWRRAIDDLAVVYLIDASASVGTDGQAKALDFIQNSLKSQGKDDQAGAVVFGAEAMVERSLSDQLRLEGLESTPSPQHTDIASALRLGAALLPGDRIGRLVLISDGEETRGDASAQALLLTSNLLQMGTVSVGGEQHQDVVVEDILVPARADRGKAYDVRVLVRSDVPVTGTLRLYRNDAFLGDLPVSLKGGRVEEIRVRQEGVQPGLHRYRAVLDVPSTVDGVPENNTAMGTVQVEGTPRILIVDPEPKQMANLRAVLNGEGFEVDVVDASGMPAGPMELRLYSAVILSDIPAFQLTQRQQEALRAYVRDLGRGLVMIGGEQSFGLGGYYQTPVEEALPVRMDLEDKSKFPSMAMIHAIDKSCSMGGQPLEMAKEAAIRSAELLNDQDQVGVIGFDGASAWVTRLQPLKDRAPIIAAISRMRADGGSDLYPGLASANEALDNSNASIRHVVVISDGMVSPGDFQTLVTDAHKRGITLTALAIGPGADTQFMKSIAQWGGGGYYDVTDPNQIPAIFSRETMLASRSFLIEEAFVPKRKDPSAVIRGLSEFPPLYGYVATEAKPRVTVPLVTSGEHTVPLLAHGQFGLGRSVAFTSDAKSRWARDWMGSEAYTRLWSQIARYAVGDPDSATLQVSSEIRDGELQIAVDAFDADGSFRNFLHGEARVVTPDLGTRVVELRQVGPGRYTGSLPVEQDGSWLVGVALSAGEELVGQTVTEAVQPYSPEYRRTGRGQALLEEIGELGHIGKLVDPAAVFARPQAPQRVPVPMWNWAIGLAAIALMIDVAVRRLEWRGGSPATARALVASGMAPARTLATPSISTAPIPALEARREVAASENPIPKPTSETRSSSNTAGKLLASKQKARKKMGDES